MSDARTDQEEMNRLTTRHPGAVAYKPCGEAIAEHDWQDSDLALGKIGTVPIATGIYETAFVAGAVVQVCSRCHLIRVKPKE